MANQSFSPGQIAQIQQLVTQQATKIAQQVYTQHATKYGVSVTPLHTHNGSDSPRVKQSDIIASFGTTGTITMSTDGQRYSIGLNTQNSAFAPSNIRFNGIVVNSTSSPTIRSMCVGDAYLGNSFYLQPVAGSSTAVTIGGPAQVVVQSSSYILVNNSGSGPATQALSDQGHIVSVTFNGSIVARATICDLGDFQNLTRFSESDPIVNGNLQIDVELASGWSIIGNFTIT